ncbi:TauD/TfdA family dioxygenase [Xenorhabdus nematophila]|uniref:Clavaminate synthase n=1 Tax=Xenorhabdus nematophila (strain ATCC 19061 / DSM 3370 / CCUG 14189 / LMG 1036 / NCIMB 9965 / AN6) TaxID=406817 RepID=D3VCN5_XENNA|nr:TauD/TfdA family dioxygenase [Xenorhabdus nematophila]CEE90789.1 putative Clavaminate synthase [Xenorhabdus nematophila str. Anatoliense]AYA42120.1 clavaminate synthase [Xenorhabdus nematophila]MBA0020843.1 TauD/TfdA family dioxygenase [Xenorhabdus nematophila]MCB4424091.1 clavaminate synthase [Xenorhabdus nematophila]QNJ36492.1 TauD/TfdA family dioxygenase [Xenorhabdus nematophila]
MKSRNLLVVYDDSFYNGLGGNNIAKNSFGNVIDFFRYYKFDVYNIDDYISKGNGLSDIDILLTTDDVSQNDIDEQPKLSIIFALSEIYSQDKINSINKDIVTDNVEFKNKNCDYLNQLDGEMKVTYKGENFHLYGNYVRQFVDYAGWQPFISYEDFVIGLEKENNNKKFYYLGLLNTYSSFYFSACDNEYFLKRIIGDAIGGVQKEFHFQSEVTFSNHVIKYEESYVTRDLSQIKGDHIIYIDNDKLLKKGFYYDELPSPYDNLNRFLSESFKRIIHLNQEIIKNLYNFKNYGNEYGVLLLKGLNFDGVLPPTPSDILHYPDRGNFYGELWLAMISEFLGYAVGYSQEKNGNIFQNLVPNIKKEFLLSSESSKKELDFHTEIAFHPLMCDYVLLYCLRQDHEKNAKTFISSAKMMLRDLSLREIQILFEPLFMTGIDYSYGSPNGVKGNGPLISILYGNPSDPYMIYDLDLMKGLNAEAEFVLDKLKKIANKHKYWVTLEAGDLLIIDNNRCVHGRSEFIPRYDGQDRWLLRTCALTDIKQASSDILEESRVINTRFII